MDVKPYTGCKTNQLQLPWQRSLVARRRFTIDRSVQCHAIRQAKPQKRRCDLCVVFSPSKGSWQIRLCTSA